MKLKNPLLHKTLGLLAACGTRVWWQTLDCKAVYFEPAVDPLHPRFDGRYVYVTWHEYLLMPIALRAGRRMLALASAHADGEMVSRALHHLGWSVARGATMRGGATAVLRLLRDDDRHPNLTPDGPLGPRRQLSAGPVFLASKLGLPLVCVGYGYDRPWRLRSWDRFAIPRPFSRARAVVGPALRLPPKLDRAVLESYRCWVERFLNWLTEEAEGWAASGRRRAGELPMLPGEACPAMLRLHGDAVRPLPSSWLTSWEALGNSSSAVNAAGATRRAHTA
jgi:hypothetical protein